MSTAVVSRSTARPRPVPVWTGRVLVVALLVAAWQFAPESIWPRDLVSRPPAIGLALWEMILDGTVWTQTWISLQVLVQGTVLSAVIGVVAAGIVYQSAVLERALNPIIGLANAIPKFAFIPVYVGLFGLGDTPKLVLLVSYMPFVFFYQALEGMHSVEKALRDSMRMMGASNLTVFLRAALPAAASRVVTATRIAVPMGFHLVVFAEIWAASSGIGYLITYNYSVALVDRAMAGVVWIFIVGLALDSGMRVVERRVNRWRSN